MPRHTTPTTRYDYVYVDGDHSAAGALFDMTVAWRLVRLGGLMVIDDVLADAHVATVGASASAFVAAHRRELRVVWSDHQLALRKMKNRATIRTIHDNDEEIKAAALG